METNRSVHAPLTEKDWEPESDIAGINRAREMLSVDPSIINDEGELVLTIVLDDVLAADFDGGACAEPLPLVSIRSIADVAIARYGNLREDSERATLRAWVQWLDEESDKLRFYLRSA